MTHDPRKTFEAARAASTGELLLRAARLLDESALERLRAQPGAPPFRPAHTRLFPHLDFEGVRATELAARLGISKQAVGQLLGDLIEWGMVEQIPDPTDGRARLVRYSSSGAEALSHGLGILAGIEAEVRARLGDQAMQTFREALQTVIDVLER